MVRKLEIENLNAEAAALDAMLRSRTAEEDPIGHMQYSERLAAVREELQALGTDQDLVASVALFFAGRPVVGSRGIRADFAGRAVEIFQDVVSKRFAANEVGDLGARGPVPLRVNSDLLLTNVARGSFGVILEESVDTLPLAQTQVKVVLDEVVASMRAAADEDGSDFEQMLETIDSRYLRSLGEFFELLDDEDATVRVVEGDVDQQLSTAEIHRARERTGAAQIDERDDNVLVGTLYLLPGPRRFELILDGGDSVSGTVSSEFATEHLEALRAASAVVGRRWRVRTRARTVTRANRAPKTTYKLLGLIEQLD
jgi:hypothetical protein